MTNRPIRRSLACLALGWIAGSLGCAGEHRDARDKYNQGVAALSGRDYEAAEKALLDARSGAGVDPELRFRAAYDLGVAFAAHADQVRVGKDADLAKALELAQQAASWLGDAQRLRPGDADTRTNLGVVRARIQAIGDELRKGEGKLEARLEQLLAEQRGVLDEARGAWLAIKETGGADPLAQQGTLTHLADRERGVSAESGVVGDLAADEIDAIGKKPDDKRSEEEKVRILQLKNLDLYLMDGRTRVTEARRKLQELAAEDGVARSEAALVAFKRAREQLLDPITVMRQVAQDELAVLQDTLRSDTKARDLDKTPDLGGGKAPAALPGWLEPPAIGERQGGIRDRLEEVRARLAAAAEAKAPALAGTTAGSASRASPAPGAPAAAGPDDVKRAKLIERVKAALPSVGDASAAMAQARQALADTHIPQAIDGEQKALEALARAIEQFSDLKQLVELAWAEHQELLRLLSPEAAKQLDSTQRARQTRDALSHNLGRMPRIGELLADELATSGGAAPGSPREGAPTEPPSGGAAPGSPRDPNHAPSGGAAPGSPRDPNHAPSGGAAPGSPGAPAQAAAGSRGAGSAGSAASGSAQDPKQAEAQKQADAQQQQQQQQQIEQARQQLIRAEELRGQAAAALAALDKALSGNTDPMPPAKQADVALTELRKIFFSVIEHLQELIREQGETRDQTQAASGEDDFTRAPKLPGLIGRQEDHAKMARAITDALSAQADAASKQPPQPGPGAPHQGPDAKALGAAADEIRQSQGDMGDARGTLVKARDAKTTTESLAPAAKSQSKALEHLENALKLLQPPPKKNDQKDKDQQQQQQKKQEQQPQPQGGAGQRARDEDARRQRERHDRDAQSDPVEKDW